MWLDETMSYSCGYFKHPEDTLYQAQVQKVERILEKLYLKEGMTLCDIGCGWGYLLIEAAKKYGIKGVGITLSKEQKKKFEERIKENHLEDQLEVRLMDYRDLPESGFKFDRVVSVGMLEHVGRDNYELFMKSVKSIMNPGGLFLLHYISALQEHPGDAWVKKYIFPGGVVPYYVRLSTLQVTINSIHWMWRVLEDIIIKHYSVGTQTSRNIKMK